MFFPDRITGIEAGHRVLDVGPGAHPHPRADVLLEMAYDDPAEYAAQFGHNEPLKTTKPVVHYDGRIFPFRDREFDYVICSHVLEHVPDPAAFLAEVFRVAPRGYIEYPLVTYEYLYNYRVHLNLLHFVDGRLLFMPKSATALDQFAPVQSMLRAAQAAGHTHLVDAMPARFMQGFQWEAPFAVEETRDLARLCPPASGPMTAGVHAPRGPGAIARALVRSLFDRFK